VAPVIVWLPQSLSAYEGAGASFAVAATGTAPFDYEWSRDFVILADGGRISGATTDVLAITRLEAADAGEYTVQVSNQGGSDDSYFLQIHAFSVEPVPAGLLYAEQFPFAGPGAENKALDLVGWVADVPSASDRLFKVSADGTNDAAGAVYAYESSAGASAFYATAGRDTGTSGLPFAPLAFGTAYPTLELAVEIASPFSASNVTARFAVQVDSNWYVSATALPVPGTDSEVYEPYTQQIATAAAGWHELTLTGSGAVIGGSATNSLAGSLTGAGLVVEHAGEGTLNFDNFEIRE
jgi:hypothetical protein